MTEMKNYGEWSVELAAPFVKKWEGFRAKAYQCTSGIWTIGYGHTGGVHPDDQIDMENARQVLASDLQDVQNRLIEYLNVSVTSGQFIALMSLAFNVGVRAVSMSKLLRKLNEGDEEGAADEFLDWTKAGGKELAGLVKRRREEREYFLRGY